MSIVYVLINFWNYCKVSTKLFKSCGYKNYQDIVKTYVHATDKKSSRKENRDGLSIFLIFKKINENHVKRKDQEYKEKGKKIKKY